MSGIRSTSTGVVVVGLPSPRSGGAGRAGRGRLALAAARHEAVPCLALPGRVPAAVHLDGACRCFAGGPAPTTA